MEKRKSTPKGCGIEEVLEKHKELLDQIHFESETQKRIFAICEELEEIPNSTLVRIGHALNGWEWLDELPGKPDGWEDMSIDEKFVWTMPICDSIKQSVGEKALSRYFHTTELGKTDREFEDWWDSVTETRLTRLEEKLNDGNSRTDYAQYERYNKSRDLETFLFYLGGFLVGCFVAYLQFHFKG